MSAEPLLNRAALNHLLRTRFDYFLQRCFETLNPTERLIWNWHIDAMAYQLSLVREGEVLRLVITIPPRHLKSITVSVAFVAWCMGLDPSLKFICASYGGDLALQLSRDFRRIVTADWFIRAFPDFKLKRIAEGDLSTTQGGYRNVTSTGGAVTGKGADIIIVDDLLKASDAHSPAALDAAREFYRDSLTTRLNDQTTGKIIVIAQRIHEDDVPGYCIETGLFTHLNLPAIAQVDQVVRVKRARTKAWTKGELLFPARFSHETLQRMRIEQSARVFNAQYLQDPTPLDSDLIRWSDIKHYSERPRRGDFLKVVQSWDTAEAESAHADYSACTTWGFWRGKWLLLDLARFKANFHDLTGRARRLREEWKPDLILIEEAGSGRHLLSEFRRELRTASDRSGLGWKLHACRPTQSKLDRWAAQAAKLQEGLALLPLEAPWLEDLRREVTGFPNSKHDDQVDSISQFLEWTGWGRTALNLVREFNRGPQPPRRRYHDPDEEPPEDDISYWLRNMR